MAARKRRTWAGRVYLGLDAHGRERYEWVGRFPTKKARDEAVMRRKLEREREAEQATKPPAERITCGDYADEYLARMESGKLLTKGGRAFKASSIDTARGQLARFKAEFGDRT